MGHWGSEGWRLLVCLHRLCWNRRLYHRQEGVHSLGPHPFMRAALPWLGSSMSPRKVALFSISPGFRAPLWVVGGTPLRMQGSGV